MASHCLWLPVPELLHLVERETYPPTTEHLVGELPMPGPLSPNQLERNISSDGKGFEINGEGTPKSKIFLFMLFGNFFFFWCLFQRLKCTLGGP